ncbi:hypothetical protein, partial [Burkholderia sp. Se-20373]|uniref:hypothetical protein n=1 Tax=Burkholderia sp. Se-20373 TaxID=2703898 RepID=UPI00197CD5E2
MLVAVVMIVGTRVVARHVAAQRRARASSANMTEDQRTAVEFYAANPSAALLDFAARVSRNCGSSA